MFHFITLGLFRGVKSLSPDSDEDLRRRLREAAVLDERLRTRLVRIISSAFEEPLEVLFLDGIRSRRPGRV
jgi:hypothetical protein